MASTTRLQTRLGDEKRALYPVPYDTPRKSQFFQAYDSNHGSKPLGVLYRDEGVRSPTARRWLRQRRQLGKEGYRSTRKNAKKRGPKFKVLKEMSKYLVSTANPVKDQSYECNIEFHNLPIKCQALTATLKKNTKNG